MSDYEIGPTPFKGWKQDVVLSEEQVKGLLGGAYIVVCIGEWDDGTPSFLRVLPPPTTTPDRKEAGE